MAEFRLLGPVIHRNNGTTFPFSGVLHWNDLSKYQQF